MFEIEKGIPIPSGCATGLTGTLRRMAVGDSVCVPGGPAQKNRLSSAFARFAHTKAGAGKRFSQRKVPEGVRIWRTA